MVSVSNTAFPLAVLDEYLQRANTFYSSWGKEKLQTLKSYEYAECLAFTTFSSLRNHLAISFSDMFPAIVDTSTLSGVYDYT